MPVIQSVGTIRGEAFACARSQKTIVVSYRFRPGSIVYSIQKANQGILEPIAIKRVDLVSNQATFGQVMVLYIDTYNAYWTDIMLCTESVAVNLAIAALQNQEAALQNQVANCN